MSNFEGQFEQLSQLKNLLHTKLCDQVGYMEPDQGANGRQIWLNTDADADVDDMYKIYEGRKEIMLWCLKNETQEDIEQSEDEIVTDYRKKQSGKYTVDKLHA